MTLANWLVRILYDRMSDGGDMKGINCPRICYYIDNLPGGSLYHEFLSISSV